jgi:hypothetical protein
MRRKIFNTISGAVGEGDFGPIRVQRRHAFQLDLVGLQAAASFAGLVAAAGDAFGQQVLDVVPAFLAGIRLDVGVLVLVDQEFAAFEADTLEHLDNFLDVVDEKHGPGQLDATEVAGGVDVRQPIGGANHARFEDAHARVEQAAFDGHTAHVGFATGDFHHGIIADFLRRKHTELDADDARRRFVFTAYFRHGQHNGFWVNKAGQKGTKSYSRKNYNIATYIFK